ncbi:MAG: hypothetical protein ACRDZR_16795, partial [Acidimicrobiales bacterium]
MIVSVTDEQADLVARAAYTVATAGGTTPLSAADRRGVASAMARVFGWTQPVDVDGLTCVPSGDLVRAVEDPGLRLQVVRVLAVLALLDGVVDKARIERALDVATALHVHAEFVDALHQLQLDHARWVGYDMIRANVMTIPGLPWLPDDPYGPFLPYGGPATDPVLARRYEQLAALEPGTFGRAFYDHYRTNGYAFPGDPAGLSEVWATPHDSLHILSGYSTSAQGELLVAAYTGGTLDPSVDFMESHVLPTILIYHLGIDLNKGLNAGDKARLEADPSWADNYDGNVHLGLDAEKLWAAWERGVVTSENVYSGHWDFWAHVATPLEELRQRWGVPPLDPSLAAVADDQVSREAFERPGLPPPPAVSST